MEYEQIISNIFFTIVAVILPALGTVALIYHMVGIYKEDRKIQEEIDEQRRNSQ